MTAGQIGYEAYGAAAGWKTFDGRSMPTWAELQTTEAGRETCRRWEEAAFAIVRSGQGPARIGTGPEFIGMIPAGSGR